LLLLLNSDVMPQAPGWLDQLCTRYRAHPDTGLLGVKLLYEDGTIQHAGMCSRPLAEWQGLWINHHPHKGLRANDMQGFQEVHAVTAACVLVDTHFYHALGGLSEDYIIGDFEDSDLCYRAREAGRPCRVDLDVVLYHLERQSQNIGQPGWREALTMYNCWLHDTRWGQDLEQGRL
jgi:O-antigen biosynthesis protein